MHGDIYVALVGRGKGRHVKVGISEDLPERVKALAYGAMDGGATIVAAFTGNWTAEQELHACLRRLPGAQRGHGANPSESYEPTREVMAWVLSLPASVRCHIRHPGVRNGLARDLAALAGRAPEQRPEQRPEQPQAREAHDRRDHAPVPHVAGDVRLLDAEGQSGP